MATIKSPSVGVNSPSFISSLDNTRRLYNFGDRVASLAPEQTPWFVYLSKVAKQSTDDPTFKFMEQRHQWQRRNFTSHAGQTADADGAGGWVVLGDGTDVNAITLVVECDYDKYGNKAANSQPGFLLKNQTVSIKVSVATATGGTGATDKIMLAKITADPVLSVAGQATLTLLPLAIDGVQCVGTNETDFIGFATGTPGEVVGSAFEEASSYPEGWADELYAREGHCQIFKTASPMMSGTAQATRYRGIANEWQRVWKEKLMEHKMDIEKGMLFGMGGTQDADVRRTWGIVPYTEKYGKVYNYAWDDTGTASAASTYDTFLAIMEDFYAPESGNSGNKLCLASRSVISYFNKIGSAGFVNNTLGTSAFQVDVSYKDGKFGHKVMQVDTVFGGFTLVQEPLFRGPYADMMMLIDMDHVKYRPLVGNGISRDTFIETNVQNNGVDGRIDQIITEAGLQVELPETHAIVRFNGNTAVTEG
tara:strand:+ start:828 stop:2258 length:1431 start_codon:yes stop_codon:yes gene_type:complete